MDSLIRLVMLLAAAYALLCALAYLAQDRLIFHPLGVRHNPVGRHVDEAAFERPDAVLRGWVVNPQASGPVVVYFGGNGEEVSNLADVFTRLEATTVLLNYRGYGSSDGAPSASALIDDARAVVATFVPRYGPDRPVILFGRSLGSGIAASVTPAVPVDGAILMSPFRSLGHMAGRVMPWLPTRWLLRHRIDVLATVDALPEGTLVLYSPADQVVPAAETEALLGHLRNSARIVRFQGGHNVSLTQPDVWAAIEAFVGSYSG